MSDLVVSVENVSKKFCRSLKKGMIYTTTDVGRDLLGVSSKPDKLRASEFWAVNDVSLELRRGECFGLIGTNGAGKSTLLKMLNGIIRPDKGAIRLRGRVGALIEVGAGFHPMLTGRENIYVNGAILGMTKREIDRKYDEIVAFSGLAPDILEAPVKTYSSGMYVRLGFSVAVHTDPDILLVDEVLAVGDIRFIGQCRKKITELRQQGTTMILVSHSLSLIEETCDRGMLMVDGQCHAAGTAKSVTAAFRQMVAAKSQSEVKAGDGASSFRFLSGSLLDRDGKPLSSLVSGQQATLELLVSTAEELTQGYLSVWIVRENDDQITGVGYLEVGRDIPKIQSGLLPIQLRCPLMPGDYRLGVTFSTDARYNLVDQFEPGGFTVLPRPDNPFLPSGIFELDVQVPADSRPL